VIEKKTSSVQQMESSCGGIQYLNLGSNFITSSSIDINEVKSDIEEWDGLNEKSKRLPPTFNSNAK